MIHLRWERLVYADRREYSPANSSSNHFQGPSTFSFLEQHPCWCIAASRRKSYACIAKVTDHIWSSQTDRICTALSNIIYLSLMRWRTDDSLVHYWSCKVYSLLPSSRAAQWNGSVPLSQLLPAAYHIWADTNVSFGCSFFYHCFCGRCNGPGRRACRLVCQSLLACLFHGYQNCATQHPRKLSTSFWASHTPDFAYFLFNRSCRLLLMQFEGYHQSR